MTTGRRCELRPGAGDERHVGRLDRLVDLRLSASRNKRPDVTGERVLALEDIRSSRVDPVPPDIGLIPNQWGW
jgi:hypothetical protein